MANFFSTLAEIPMPSIQDLRKNIPWSDLFKGASSLARQGWERLQKRGLYEVLDYETTLELLDKRGEKAIFHKHQKVRYLQDNIIAYQDQAWGDGDILIDYSCAPGQPVDYYNLGHKMIILISLREIKQRGDFDEFLIQWRLRNAFLKDSESWETEISHRTQHIKISLIFPALRPPLRVETIQGSNPVSEPLPIENRQRLPDGRWQTSWEMIRPRLNERYLMKWDW